ncbi:hypothetical protein [Sulfuricurvum sp.]|uniref:hypothetical protein n=1 Tax=Sulfuricurvum sp. TaxID=2025608 RepID=UPI0025F69025|nr:hypothetical protein [Sulfuricurvum sp.]
MKTILNSGLIVGMLCASLSASNFDIGISGSEQGIDGFSLSVGDYYRVPQQEIVVIERSIPRDEMSVVYFLARESHRDAGYITDLRLHGGSWWDISLRLGLDPRTLYVIDSHRYNSPPYGKAYGYHKGKKHRLKDSEIIELVNVRFLSDYHHISYDEVIDRRRGGERYNRIDEHYRAKKDRPEYRNDEQHDGRGSHGEKSHGNGHEH